MDKIIGVVEAVSQKDNRYGLKINGEWFNGFGDSPVEKGDEVSIEYDIKGTFKNVVRVQKKGVTHITPFKNANDVSKEDDGLDGFMITAGKFMEKINNTPVLRDLSDESKTKLFACYQVRMYDR